MITTVKRISIALTKEDVKQLEYLQKKMKVCQSEVIKECIRSFYNTKIIANISNKSNNIK